MKIELTNINDVAIYDIPDIDLTVPNDSFAFQFLPVNNKTYTLRAYFYDSTDNTIPKFYSATTYFSTGDGGGIVPTAPDYQFQECTGTDVACYVKDILRWAFVPSDAVLASFSGLTLENSLPFSYIYDMPDLYDELFDVSPDSFSISIPFGAGSISLLSTDQLEDLSFQPLVRTILGAILIFFTVFAVYRRIIKIHDSNHKTTT